MPFQHTLSIRPNSHHEQAVLPIGEKFVFLDRPENVGDDTFLIRPDAVNAVNEKSRRSRAANRPGGLRHAVLKTERRRKAQPATSLEAVRFQKQNWPTAESTEAIRLSIADFPHPGRPLRLTSRYSARRSLMLFSRMGRSTRKPTISSDTSANAR